MYLVIDWILVAPQKPAVVAAIPLNHLTYTTRWTLVHGITIDGLEAQVVAGNLGEFADVSRWLTAVREQKYTSPRARQCDEEKVALLGN